MEHEDLSSLSHKKLKKLIKETEEVLVHLKEEMKRRKLDKQHTEINHLEEHMEDAEHNLSNLKTFIQKVMKELRKD